MKKFVRYLGILLLCLTLISPNVEASDRNERGHQRTDQKNTRPGNNGRPNNSNRPNNNKGNKGHNSGRPGNSGHNQGNNNHKPDRPGNNGHNQGNNNHRPDHPGNNGHNQGNNNHRPDHPGNNANRPGNNNHRPNNPGNHAPAPQPGRPGPGGPGYGRPVPHHAAWFRPTPPPGWRPPRHWRPIRSVLGITFGTAINLSINALINSGYTVSAYDNNTVFVNNVPMLNMLWPDAYLFYNGGGLYGSRFLYSTDYYDRGRYNMAYSALVNFYGSPMSVRNTSAGIEATWWGAGNQFIRLSFSSLYNQYGRPLFQTTLSYGI